MAILKIKDDAGNIINIPAIKGEKGDRGPQGVNGANGKDGADGKTPVKGVDYFTDADKAEIVQSVLAALPNAEGVEF